MPLEPPGKKQELLVNPLALCVPVVWMCSFSFEENINNLTHILTPGSQYTTITIALNITPRIHANILQGLVDEIRAALVVPWYSSCHMAINLINFLRKIGILRFGSAKGTFHSAKDKSDELTFDRVYDAKKDQLHKEDFQKFKK
ncbi:MAG TPA: hypothetical protein VN397_02060 [Candidatus Methylomirabilis sp.]|nr:hypothetical protein [Candidatus Methylomirabilis sp.]